MSDWRPRWRCSPQTSPRVRRRYGKIVRAGEDRRRAGGGGPQAAHADCAIRYHEYTLLSAAPAGGEPNGPLVITEDRSRILYHILEPRSAATSRRRSAAAAGTADGDGDAPRLPSSAVATELPAEQGWVGLPPEGLQHLALADRRNPMFQTRAVARLSAIRQPPASAAAQAGQEAAAGGTGLIGNHGRGPDQPGGGVVGPRLVSTCMYQHA